MQTVLDNLDLYWGGFYRTLGLAFFSGLIALVLGVVLATLRVSPLPPLRAAGTVYVEVLRNTPLTVVFFFSVTVLPQLGPILPFYTGALIALSAYTAAFVCEAVRSGINSVGPGQAEAARSIGLNFVQVLRYIVLPQALRTVVPPLVNVLIALTKNTSVAGGFLVAELFGVGRRLTNAFATDVLAVLLGVAFFYLILTIPLGVLAGRIERRVAIVR